MSKKKRKRKELEAALAVGAETPKKVVADDDDAASKPAGITRGQRVLSVLGFGFCGFLAAFLTGANLNPHAPAELSGVSLASWEGAVLGSRLLNLGKGAVEGVGGLLLGGALGFSIFLSPIAFTLNWLGGGIASYAVYHTTGSFVLSAAAWVVGSTLPLALGKLVRG